MILWGSILKDLKKKENEIQNKKKFNEVYDKFFKNNPSYSDKGYVSLTGKKVFPSRDEKLYLFHLFFDLIEREYTT